MCSLRVAPDSVYMHDPASGTPRSTSALISLTKVANWDGKSHNIHQVLAAAFEADDYIYQDCVKNLQKQGIDPMSYINNLDKVGSRSI